MNSPNMVGPGNGVNVLHDQGTPNTLRGMTLPGTISQGRLPVTGLVLMAMAMVIAIAAVLILLA